MRASLFVAFALLLLGLAWLVSRGGFGESPGVELSSPGLERSIREPGDDPAATPPEGPEERAEADAGDGEATEPVETPPSQALWPWGVDRRRVDPEDTLLLVCARTPEGNPLRDALALRREESPPGLRGYVDLESRLSYEPIEVGSTAPEPPRWNRDPIFDGPEDSPFIKTRSHLPGGSQEGALEVLSFRAEAPTVFVSLLANGRVLAIQHVRCDVQEVEFIVSVEAARSGHCGVRARFVDGAGRPVEGALVDPRAIRTMERDVETDVEGRVELGLLEPGTYEFEVSHEGFATTLLRLQLEAGVTLDLGTIVLAEPVTIAGRLIGPDSEVRGREIVVRLVSSPAGEPASAPDRQVISDSGGRFSLEDLEPGVYALRVASQVRVTPGRRTHRRAAYFSPFVRVDATDESVHDAVVELEPGNPVKIRLHYTGEEPVDLRVLDAEGFRLKHHVHRHNVIETTWNLPSGRLRLVATRGDRTETIEFESVAGVELDVGP